LIGFQSNGGCLGSSSVKLINEAAYPENIQGSRLMDMPPIAGDLAQTLARGTTVYGRVTHELAVQTAGGAGHWCRHSEAGLDPVLTA
jgi:hypothetical protein